MLTRRTLLATASFALAAPYVNAMDGTHVVEMLNKHPEDRKQRQIFLPRLIAIDQGDKVLFKATDPGHNSASIAKMMPDGAVGWDGALGKDVEVTFEVPGFYGYVCTPHASTGMVGMVVVNGDGMLNNLEAAQGVKHRGKSRKVWGEIWEEAESLGFTS